MKSPLLSLLIASVPNRTALASALFRKLDIQCQGRPVEILMFTDNRWRTLGEKMNDLMDLARGRYLTFIDDDDDVEGHYVELVLDTIVHNVDVHVINYRVSVTLDGERSMGFVYPSLKNPNEEFRPDRITLRKPMQTSVWRADLAKSSRWGVGQYNVDAAWAKPLWDLATTEAYIAETLYHYRRHQVPSEAT